MVGRVRAVGDFISSSETDCYEYLHVTARSVKHTSGILGVN